MRNLLQETLNYLKELGYSDSNVSFVVTDKHILTWDQFAHLATKVNYQPASYKRSPVTSECRKTSPKQINPDLMIVGDQWWLERRDSRFTEHWYFVAIPQENSLPRTDDISTNMLTAKFDEKEEPNVY